MKYSLNQAETWPEDEAAMEAAVILELLAEGENTQYIHSLVYKLAPHWINVFKNEEDKHRLLDRFINKFNSLMPVGYHIQQPKDIYDLMP